MSKSVKYLLVAASIILVLIIIRPFFIVEEGQQAVVTRFGKITRVDTEAGLKFKVPMVDTVKYYPKKIFSWDGEPRKVPTSEQLYVWVDSTARWKITDPALFYQSLDTEKQAQGKLDDIIESTLKTVIAQYPLVESVRSTNKIIQAEKTAEIAAEMAAQEVAGEGEDVNIALASAQNDKIEYGRSVLSRMMLDEAAPNVERFGMELIDVVIRQIKFNDELTQSVHERMIQERAQIAADNRAQGEGVKEELLGQLTKDKDIILSAAKADAEVKKGEADAEAARIYAEAYSRDAEFYRFWKAMESYKKTIPNLDKILTTDMEYFDYLYTR